MQKIIILDFGGQYCHLIARRLRDIGVYAEILPAATTAGQIKKIPEARGVVLSGGAMSVYGQTSPQLDAQILELGLPILGICYGHQLIAKNTGGEVKSGRSGEYGLTKANLLEKTQFLPWGKVGDNLNKVWMNHKDIVVNMPEEFKVVAKTKHSPVAVFVNQKEKIYGVQFHPEVTHTERGSKILANFALKICECSKDWGEKDLEKEIITEIKKYIGNKKAIIGLSGGIDSSVAAILCQKALGKNLTAVYVDTGLMRHKETEFIRQSFAKFDLNLKIAMESKRFFVALKDITSPERKRKIIGKVFIDIFNEYAKKVGAEVLIQGTIYSDRIESGGTEYASNIKSHHNVGGLPKKMKLRIFEPLREMYKDEVRALAKTLKISSELIARHVFPGPGMGIRIIGAITPKKAAVVRRATYIIEEELKKHKLYNKIYMGFAVLLSIKSVGIQGDARTYKYPIVVKIIESRDVMTANFARVSYDVLEKISTRITNEIKEVNRVLYEISNKPPATMEWE